MSPRRIPRRASGTIPPPPAVEPPPPAVAAPGSARPPPPRIVVAERDAEPIDASWAWLDRVVAPRASFAGLEVAPYKVLGVGGIAAGAMTLVGVGLPLGLPLAGLLAIAVAALAIFVLAAFIRRAWLGHERHVLLEDVLLVLAGGAGVAAVTALPVWSSLDALVLALGTFLVFGRLGCTVSGCCHGRPARVGVCYREPGAVPPLLLGVRLFPLQLVEAASIAFVTAIGVLVALRAAPGAALWWWLLSYGAARFVLEMLRGDRRPRLGPLSEAQWLVLAVVAARVALEEHAELHLPRLLALALALIVIVVAYATRTRWLEPEARLVLDTQILAWSAWLSELERAADLAGPHGVPAQAAPSGGVQVALTIDRADGGWLHSYRFSRAVGAAPLAPAEARFLAGLVAQRLPGVRCLRCTAASDAAAFDAWFLARALPSPQMEPDADPVHVRWRALAFAPTLTDPSG